MKHTNTVGRMHSFRVLKQVVHIEPLGFKMLSGAVIFSIREQIIYLYLLSHSQTRHK
jgi:hypothetical protein